MKGATKKMWLIIASVLVVAGGLLFVSVLWANNWNFSIFSTSTIENNTHEISEDFDGISINSDTAKIVFAPSENGKTIVACREKSNARYSVSVKDGKLTIELVDKSKWYENIFNFGREEVTVYLPEGEYGKLSIDSSTSDVEISKEFKFECIDISLSTGDVKSYASAANGIKITASTGDIYLESISAKAIDLSVSTGEINIKNVNCEGELKIAVSTGYSGLENVRCDSLISTGDTGDITLTSVIAGGKYDIKRSTGDIKLVNCDAAEIYIETSTGNVKGNLLTEKVFIVNTSTGKKDVPETLTGGKCKISTSTGDVILTVGGI